MYSVICICSTYLGGFNIDFLSTITEANIKFIKSDVSHTNISLNLILNTSWRFY